MGEENYLFKPIKIGNKISENRIAINAMECCDSDEEGNPSEKTYRRYQRHFEGGSGVVVLEAITVGYESRSRKYQLSIMPRNEKALAKFVSEMKRINPKTLFFFQLTHSGELSHPDFSKRVCVKPLPGFGGELLTEDDVEKIMDQFVTSAKIAHSAGADGIDIKLCHGYLGSQFIRPYNDRKWKFGGSWENRTRFPYTIYERVQKEINDPNFILGSKVSIWEGFPGGCGSAGPDTAIMDLTESLDLVKGIEERGAKFIIVSAGSPSITLALSQPDKKIPDDVYLHFGFQKAVKSVVKPETVVIGSAYSVLNNGNNALQAVKREEASLKYWGNKNIKDGVTDMIAIGRQSLADSLLPAKMKAGKEDTINWCTACDNCIEFLIRQKNVGCATYDKEYADSLRQIRREEGLLKAKRT
ncbi:MAG: 2,4-dienoyl-CoA reductase [Actinobacteria bacterium]|nr:2,4-dienoyl-CoA reductase [Cyanobacteriota bacterium]MCL5770859.1 2,4-dienoyl-CoA reductase [Actinomycetota bacterium]